VDIKTTKNFLSKILKDDYTLNIINDCVYKTNNIVFHTYNFLKLYILYLYENKLNIPIIDENFISSIMIIISNRKTKQGRPPNSNTQEILDKLTNFYNKNYKEVIIEEDIVNNDRLSFILNYEAIDIVKNIRNNIKINYIKHLKKYIKIIFNYNKECEYIKTIKDKDIKSILYKKINSDINLIIEDILNVSNNNYKSNIKYHNWINKYKYKLIPKKEKYNKNSINYDVCSNTLDYFKQFIYINKKLEKLSEINNNIKIYNILPLKKSFIANNITLDTASIISIFCNNNFKFLKNINNYKDEIWRKFFNLDNKVFKRNNYKFNYMIKTDGVSVSIILVKIDENNLPIKYTFNQILNMEKRKEEIDKQYIEDQNNINEIFLNKNYVVIDPNKEDLMYCMDKNGNKFRYTQSQRKKETKSKKYNLILDNLKKDTIIIYNNNEKSIKEIESELSIHNTKTCNYKKFKEYLLLKNKLYSILNNYYKENIHRKLRMNAYINTQRSESNLTLNFRKKFGKPEDTIVLMGDYDEHGKYMKGREPTICSKIRELLRKRKYKVYMLNEYRTSKLCWKCESEVKRFYKRENENNLVWGLVCCQNRECVREIQTNEDLKYDKRIMNRDTNAVLNMLKIINSLIEIGIKPCKYIKTC
jgi:hypothetical protein